MDPAILTIDAPVSNLPFLCCDIEKIVFNQLARCKDHAVSAMFSLNFGCTIAEGIWTQGTQQFSFYLTLEVPVDLCSQRWIGSGHTWYCRLSIGSVYVRDMTCGLNLELSLWVPLTQSLYAPIPLLRNGSTAYHGRVDDNEIYLSLSPTCYGSTD